jgi:hypothetical protein
VAIGGWAGAAGDRGGAAEAGEGRWAVEAADVAGVRDDGGCDGWSGAGEIGDRIAVLAEQARKVAFELGDTPVELVDLARELTDTARCRFGGQALAEGGSA